MIRRGYGPFNTKFCYFFNIGRFFSDIAKTKISSCGIHRRKMSAHALLKMTRDLFRVISLAPRRKCPRNVVQVREAMVAFFGSDSVAISCHCKRSKIILVKVLTEVCSLENIAS